MSSTPVAVFTYNRPDHTRQLLNSLSKCARLDECKVFIFSDGARVPEHRLAVDETRRIIRNWAEQNEATIVEREENWGLARSIVSGVDQLCEEFGRVIVVEDDMILSPRFVDYMISALDRYQHDDLIYQISGFMFPVPHSSDKDVFFLPLTTTWGWATWQRAWKLYSMNTTEALTALENPVVQNAFDLDGSYPFSQMLKDSVTKRNDSWGIHWWWTVFQAKKLVLHPSHSLVSVGGFDGTGTNAGLNKNAYIVSAQDVLSHPWPDVFMFPEETAVDQAAFERIKNYLRQRTKKSPNGLSKTWAQMKKEVLSMIGGKRFTKWMAWFDQQMTQARLTKYANSITMASTAQLGNDAVIDNIRKGREHICIGEHSYVRGHLITYGHGGEIKIGDWCYVGARSEIWSMDSIHIGNRVLIAHDVNIMDGTAHSADSAERHEHFRHILEDGHPRTWDEMPGVLSAPIVIEDDVWISFGVTILKGVRIGKGSIVAAGSIVTKDVPENVMYRNEVHPVIIPLQKR